MGQPLNSHTQVEKQILRYLEINFDHGLLLQPRLQKHQFPLYAYCDVDWGSDVDYCRSTSSAYLFREQPLLQVVQQADSCCKI